MCCVTKIDFGFRLLRQGLDLRVFFLQPLLDQGLVALQGVMQRLLAGDAELGQKPPHRNKAQGNLEFVPDQFGDHLAASQRESELHLQQVLLGHVVKDVHTQSETARRRTAIDPLHMSGDLD